MENTERNQIELVEEEEGPILSPEELQMHQEKLNQENKRQWEDGRVDWMGQHQSDRIINRLKNLIQK